MSREAPRILVLTNLYPTAQRPFVSPFVKEQVESLRTCFPELTLDVRVIKGSRPRAEYLRETLRLPGVVKMGGYDIVHAHFGLTLVSLLLVRVPTVVTFHGSDVLVNPTRQLSRLLAPLASKVIVVAHRLKEALGYGEVIPCGIAVQKFAPPSSGALRPGPGMPGKLNVLFPADPARRIKDYGLFQAACAELTGRGHAVQEVHLVQVDRARVQEVYWDCDLMLLTSLSEGSPTVIKEAIAAKLPFVSVDVGDVREWAAQVQFGAVVRDRDPRSIADAAQALLSRIPERFNLDNASCLEAMDIDKVAGRIRGVYRELLERGF